MAGVNKVILVGHLGSDPEVRYPSSGTAVASFNIAISRSWNSRDGQRQEKTEWVKIVAWEKLAEICGQHLSKGRQVYVEGELQTREWTDKEGNKRKTTEVRARDVQFLGSKDGGGRRAGGEGSDRGGMQDGGSHSSSSSSESHTNYGPPPGEDDVPF